MTRLVSQISYWERNTLLGEFDFLVIGNGLIGKQIAYHLQRTHKNSRVGLADRSPFSAGASTRNAGFACFGSVTELMADLERSSEHEVFDLVEKRYRGIELLKTDFGADAIGFVPTGSWEIFLPGQESVFSEARHRLEYFNDHMKVITGHSGVFKHTSSAALGFKDLGEGIVNTLEGQLDTGLLNKTIQSHLMHLGVEPLYGLTVTDFTPSALGYDVHTQEGYILRTKKLVIATNAFTGKLIPELDIVPARGQVLITRPFEKVPFTGTFHSDGGYMYFRNVGNRILLGGGRNHFLQQEQTADMDITENLQAYLEQYLREWLIPGITFETDMTWSGIMAMGSSEKLPLLQQINDNLVICVRMGGMGVALAPVLAREVAAMFSKA